VVLLMPTDEGQQARLYETAAATVERATTFCDRNPNTCAAGSELWTTFIKKAEFAARMAIELVNNRNRHPEPLPSGPASDSAGVQPRLGAQPASRGTLTPADLGPAWRGRLSRAAN
jgi:hypothetical protein